MSGGAHDPVNDCSAFAALPPELLLSILQRTAVISRPSFVRTCRKFFALRKEAYLGGEDGKQKIVDNCPACRKLMTLPPAINHHLGVMRPSKRNKTGRVVNPRHRIAFMNPAVRALDRKSGILYCSMDCGLKQLLLFPVTAEV